MTCREFEEVVMDAARGAAAEPEHARSCGRCAVRLAAERRLTEALRAVAEEDEEFSAGLGAEARLREQFRRLHATPRRKAWRWAGVAGGAIAAGLAMLAVLREPPRPPVERRIEPARSGRCRRRVRRQAQAVSKVMIWMGRRCSFSRAELSLEKAR